MNWVFVLNWAVGSFCGGTLVGWRLARRHLNTRVQHLVKKEFKLQVAKLESMMRHPAHTAGRATPRTTRHLTSVDETRELPIMPRYRGDGPFGEKDG